MFHFELARLTTRTIDLTLYCIMSTILFVVIPPNASTILRSQNMSGFVVYLYMNMYHTYVLGGYFQMVPPTLYQNPDAPLQ